MAVKAFKLVPVDKVEEVVVCEVCSEVKERWTWQFRRWLRT